MNKLQIHNCPKCGASMNIIYIPNYGMDIEPTGMKATCTRCGFTQMVDSLDDKSNRHNAEVEL